MRIGWLALVLVAGCRASIPSGVYPCDRTSDCPPEMVCQAQLCVRATTLDGGRDAGSDAGVDARIDAGSDAAAVDAGTDGGSCAPFRIQADADTSLYRQPNCGGANHAGYFEDANIGLGIGLFRFVVPPALDLAGRPPRSASLVLYRNLDCLKGSGSCPAASGNLCTTLATSRWDEGSSGEPDQPPTAYGGAEWCRRLMGNGAEHWLDCPDQNGAGCGAGPPNSIATTSECIATDAAASSVRLPVDPAGITEALTTFEAGRLTVRVHVPNGDAVFVASTRENEDPGEQAPVLEIEVCP